MEDNRNRNIIIALVIILLLCCCCAITIWGGWTFGDGIVEFFNTL